MSGLPRDIAARQQVSELTAIAELLSDRATKVTTAVYQMDGDGQVQSIGSGVLLAIDGARFLVTAAHVFDRDEDGALLVGCGTELIEPTGVPLRIVEKGAAAGQPDSVDIKVIRLGGEAWDATDLSNFASLGEIDQSPPIFGRQAYGLVGYPSTKNARPMQGDRVRANAYRIVGLECEPAAYAAYDRDPDASLLVGFDRKRIWSPDGIQTAPDLYGVSGAGFWRYGRKLRYATQAPVLGAIAIEWHREGQYKHILATRIGPILEQISVGFPDVKPKI